MNFSFMSSWKMRLLFVGYQAIWVLLLPVFFVYLWHKGRREPLYRQFLLERLGFVSSSLVKPIWLHSASMGELRGVAPLVNALLESGHSIFITTLTPAGRQTAQSLFANDIVLGKVQVSFLPLELSSAVRRFIRHINPICAMMSEIDTWPVLLATIQNEGLALCMVNAQYPKKSFNRDLLKFGGFRSKFFSAYDMVLCKSETHALRFREVGCKNVSVVGETRFDLPISQAQIDAAEILLAKLNITLKVRPIIAFVSSVTGEDALFIEAIELIQKGLEKSNLHPKPLFIYVPRNLQRFDAVCDILRNANLNILRRSKVFDAKLMLTVPVETFHQIDVILGDSIGEMYFYLAMSHVVVVGASFVPLGAHNIIEPLALKKPVMVGPSIWGIEYPGVEALACGVLQQHMTIPSLAKAMLEMLTNPQAYAQAMAGADIFYKEHAGSTEKHMAVLLPWLKAHDA
jgi:3-deoxy-D-manno-octulosonic-acid transferase